LYDDAGRLAAHAYARLGYDFFGPYLGRVGDAGDPSVVANAQRCIDRNQYLQRELQENVFYCLFDRFHQSNSKTEADKLRRMDLISELEPINSQGAEQNNRWLGKFRFSANNMRPELFFLEMRVQIGHRNAAIYAKMVKKIQELAGRNEMSLQLLYTGPTHFM
jgi:hypothetical protein